MLGWPLVCIGLFAKWPTEKAAIWSLLAGYMLLPSNWQILEHPPMDKSVLTGISTLLLCWMKGTQAPRPRASVMMAMLALGFIVAPIFSSFDNSYELQEAGKSVHGFYTMDGVKFAFRNLTLLVPLYIGWRFLSTDSARTELLRALPTGMLVYSLPMLFEIRMSPQLHRWVYGYFPSAFNQQMRAGGFRPVVFFPHGLSLALFTALAVLAAVIVARMKVRVGRFPAGAVAAYLSGLLMLCKSLGPVLYGVLFAPIVYFTRPRTWVKIGCGVSLVVCAYPFLHEQGWTPTEIISQVASTVSADRNVSFHARVENETQLLTKADQKPFFGWGGWGRNRIFDKWTGQDISVTDGGWIILFGTYGWWGYLCLYGLLALAQFRALRAVGKESSPGNLARAGLSLFLTVLIIDSVPNAMQEWLIYLLAGCIASAVPLRRKAPKPLAAVKTRQLEPALAK